MPLLSMEKICKTFGEVQANRDVDLTVERGEIHALLGENGAGKTTLMNILYGIYQADGGSISLRGRPVHITSPREAIAQKIGMVHQHFMLVPTLSVSQNITLGIKDKGFPFTDRKAVDQKIVALSDEYGLAIEPGKLISDLSVGVRQRVEIIKLLYHEAELLILDEPTAVLTPQETQSLFQVLRRLKNAGHSVIIITHRIAEVQSIADKVTVLRDGKKVADLDIGQADSSRLSQLMIGRQLNEAACALPARDQPPEAPARLSLRGISLAGENKNILDDICLDIRPGEILGLAGVDGNGQKELAEVIVGIRRASQGELRFNGRDIGGLAVRKRKRLGIAYVPDDRHHDGLILDMDVESNLLLNAHDAPPFARFKFMLRQICRTHAQEKTHDLSGEDSGREHPGSPVVRGQPAEDHPGPRAARQTGADHRLPAHPGPGHRGRGVHPQPFGGAKMRRGGHPLDLGGFGTAFEAERPAGGHIRRAHNRGVGQRRPASIWPRWAC